MCSAAEAISFTARVKEQARMLGFDLVGVSPAAEFPELSYLHEWLARGHAGQMRYLQASAETRADIRKFLPTARAVIVTATNYYTNEPEHKEGTHPARVARYAWGEDYHRVLEERLDRLVLWMREQSDEPFEARVFVDKHHVQERVFARYAGLGWIGKNTCLIHPEIGSWLFLAGVAVSLPLEPDAPVEDRCGACTICVDNCPTGALVSDYEMDASRCISYFTIEHKGSIPEERRAQLGDHVFGCDICQDVCPYNLAPLSTLDPAWQARSGRADSDASELWRKSDHELHDTVAGSAMTRTSLSRLRRNLAVVLGNSGDPAAADTLDSAGGGVRRAAQSAETPLAQEHVAWARERLAVKA